MVKLSLNSGHLVGRDSGACGNGYHEADLVELAQNETSRVLRSEYVLELEDTDKLYTDDVKEANQWGADFAIEYHLNSASATSNGFETFVFTGHKESLDFQRKLHPLTFDIVKKYGITSRDRGQQQSTQYHYLKATRMPAIIIEFCFISNATEAKKFADNAVKVGADMAHAIAKALNLPKKATPTPPPTVDTSVERVEKRYPETGQFVPNTAEGGIYIRKSPLFTDKTDVMYLNGEICPAKGQYYQEVVLTNKYVYIVYKRSNGSLGYLPIGERGKQHWGTIS